jgi:hypothetical protein
VAQDEFWYGPTAMPEAAWPAPGQEPTDAAAHAAINDFLQSYGPTAMPEAAWPAPGQEPTDAAAHAAINDFVAQMEAEKMWAQQVSPWAAGQPQSPGTAFPVFWPTGQPATPGAFSTAAFTHPVPDHASSSLRRRRPADPAAAPQGRAQPPGPGSGAHGR